MIFSGGGSLLSSRSIDASSARNGKRIPNERMQHTSTTPIAGFTGADYKKPGRETKEKMLAGLFAN